MRRIFLLFSTITLIVSTMWAQPSGSETEKPLVTIACLSDVHAMNSMITPSSGSINDITVRSSFIQTLRQMKEQEDIDVIVLGGDCQSDKTIAEANAMQVRRVINNVTREVFDEDKPKNVLWVTGNHDYEVANFDDIPKPYCAGDFYRFPMKDDVGKLADTDLFYEDADNGTLGTQTLLAAYHYRLCGLDFIILNCGKNFWKSAWDYTYSPESAQWVKEKLDEIYADDPSRTVFFCLHIPFPDSNSLNSGKGMNTGAAYTTLKSAFCEHPNLIMLYGHDHGKDGAYTREKTSQRVTRYDINGNVISSTDETHVDGPIIPNEEGEYPAIYKKMQICSTHDNTYLGFGEYNLSTVTAASACVISRNSGESTYSIKPDATPPSGCGQFILSSSSGRYSGNGSPLPLYLYKVEDIDAETLTLTRDAEPENGAYYVIVGQNAKDTGTFYALTNEHYKDDSSSQRLLGYKFTNLENGVPAPSVSIAKTALARSIWQFKDAETSTETSVTLYIRSKQDGTYMGYNAYNLTTLEQPAASIFKNTVGNEYYSIIVNGSDKYLFSSSGGRFSGNSAAAVTYIYKVIGEEDGKVTLQRGATPEAGGGAYMFVGQNAKDASTWYAVTNEHYSDGNSSQRLIGKQITTLEDGIPAATLVMDASDVETSLWLLEEKPEAKAGEGSFFSAFMGSMRYYYNSIDTGDPSDMPTVVQALMVYVYSDRVVLSMKNYNKTGMLQGITINKELATYTSYRPVTLYTDPNNIVTGMNEVESFKVQQPKVYDLSGRLCQPSEKLHSGVYIQNGVKFVK
ncbi:MAG: metallophosphoesterase [Bacteroidaceae bacterium]|nr:metallophosphoesterase [Bacteroidaceae bacterium]